MYIFVRFDGGARFKDRERWSRHKAQCDVDPNVVLPHIDWETLGK